MQLVSVIVTTYNRKDLLTKTIDSILNQTYKNYELIVIDNYSNYDFLSHIKSFNDERIRSFQSGNDGIIAVNRNYGIKKSKGEYIAFCDDDDLWYPEKLKVSMEYIEKYSADIVYHDLYYINSKGKVKLFNNKNKTREFNKPVKNDLLYNGNGINNSSVVIKKDVLLNVGLITEDKNKISWEDYHTWIKIAEHNFIFKRIPICLGYYLVGNQKISYESQVFKNFENIKKYYSNDVGNRNLWWINYIKSRLFYTRKDYKSTISELNKIDYNLISVLTMLKIKYMIIRSRVKSLGHN
jgi:glycosyltransferase involved in cell wall biosynthesis